MPRSREYRALRMAMRKALVATVDRCDALNAIEDLCGPRPGLDDLIDEFAQRLDAPADENITVALLDELEGTIRALGRPAP